MQNGHADVVHKIHFDMHTPATVTGVGQHPDQGIPQAPEPALATRRHPLAVADGG